MKNRFHTLSRSFLMLLAMLFLANLSYGQSRYRVGYKDEGFTVVTEGSLLIPSNTYQFGYNTNLIGGVLAGKWLVGGGVGMDVYKSDFFVTPFATGRYFFSGEQLSTFALLDAGYALPVDADSAVGGGPVITPGFGIRYFATRSVALNLSLIYRFHSMPIDRGIADESTSLRTNFINAFGVRIGMQF